MVLNLEVSVSLSFSLTSAKKLFIKIQQIWTFGSRHGSHDTFTASSATRRHSYMKSKQPALTSELLNLWVVLWSPSQKGFYICKVEEMIGDGIKTMAGNLIEQDWVCVWISRDWEDCQAAADYFQKKS